MTKTIPSTDKSQHNAPRPGPLAADVQEGTGRSKSRDERLKRLVKRHPQRDEPRADSVEPSDQP